MWLPPVAIMDPANIQLFHKMFNGVHNALTIFGLSFIERSEQSGLYQLSYKRLAYGFLISLFVLFVFHQQITRFYPDKLDDIVLIILYLYMAAVGTLMALAMIATAASHAPALARLLNNPDYQELFSLDTYSYVKFHTIQQFIFACCVLIGCYFSDFIAGGQFDLVSAVQIMMFFFFPMYNSFCISQFFVYHYWLQRWYWNINAALEQLLDWDRQQAHVFGVLEMSRCLQIGAGNKFDTTNPVFNVDLLASAEVVRLRRLYHKTHSVACLLNQTYSLRNVLLLIHHWALEIVYTYWGLRHTLEDLNVPLTAILNFYKAAFMSFVSVVSMVWPCTTTRVQVKRTHCLVQDLLAKVKGGETRIELQIFSVQLLQEKYQFTPHGFFEIDTNMLLGLLAAVTSYLVVLLQYHMMHLALQAKKTLHTDVQIQNITAFV